MIKLFVDIVLVQIQCFCLYIFFFYNKIIVPYSQVQYLANLGEARGCSKNHCHSMIQKVTLFLPWLDYAAKPKRLEMVHPVIKYTMLHRLRTFLTLKDIKIALLVQKLKRFAGCVDFAYWWSCIRIALPSMGLTVQFTKGYNPRFHKMQFLKRRF